MITRGVIAMVVMGWGITNLAIIRTKKLVKKNYVYHPIKRTLRSCTINLRVYHLFCVTSLKMHSLLQKIWPEIHEGILTQ